MAKLAHFKELQARYSAVKEQRERAESTQRILQQMPTAGSDDTWGRGIPWFPVRWELPLKLKDVPKQWYIVYIYIDHFGDNLVHIR